MKALAGAVLLAAISVGPVCAQEADRSLQRIAVELQRSPPPTLMRGPDEDAANAPTRLGLLTFVPPVFRGEFVRLSLPIGDLVTRAVRSLSGANGRREEETARRRVEAELKAFTERAAAAKPHQ